MQGLDTLNPTLIIDEKFRLVSVKLFWNLFGLGGENYIVFDVFTSHYSFISQIGEYEETIGTCLVFSECGKM